MKVRASSLRALAGATSVIVPLGIVVHLVSEALALGTEAFAAAFWIRHAYLIAPLALALWTFSDTVGLGRPRAEMTRRCALVRAQLRHAGGGSTIVAFTAANLAFFAVTQVLEGVPIAAGSVFSGLAIAAAGSLLAALVIYFWGRSIAAIALALALARPRNAGRFTFTRRRLVAVPRAAGRAFSLFVPNRPPPIPSLG